MGLNRMTDGWRWAAARACGTSHVKTGLPCQDFALSETLASVDETVMAVIVSDGAGSAKLAQIGSKSVCIGLLRLIRGYLANHSLSQLREEMVWDWIDDIREYISAKASRSGTQRRDFAATSVAALMSENGTVIFHIGDGAAVVRYEGDEAWDVPSWPYQGEYASTTSFITDDPQPHLTFVRNDRRVDRFAVFSDGIERLVLNSANRSAHEPFFNRMVTPLALSEEAGRNLPLSMALREYLESPSVCERTDDDKTLVLGVRK
ncbi:protein phosphatase 2C domain-containing protein (plasmid) [Rhizobium sp. CCGE531]|nr:protein phosphatase 2C domain-containing protein [Rhizobium sp. CCGE531]